MDSGGASMAVCALHDASLFYPWFFYGAHMVLLWTFMGFHGAFTMVYVISWCFHGASMMMVVLWCFRRTFFVDTHDPSVMLSQCFHGTFVDCHGDSMVLSFNWHGASTMLSLWCMRFYGP